MGIRSGNKTLSFKMELKEDNYENLLIMPNLSVVITWFKEEMYEMEFSYEA